MANNARPQISGHEFAQQVQEFATNTPTEVKERIRRRVEELREDPNPAATARTMNAIIK